MPHSRPQIATTAQVKTRRRVFTLLTLLAAVLVSFGYWLHTLPGRWLRQAGDILVSTPAKADALAVDVITLGWGNQDQAWLVRCRANLAQHNEFEAIGAFSQIKQPENCVVDDWCKMIEEAQATRHQLLVDMSLSTTLRMKTERSRLLTLALPLTANTLDEAESVKLVEELRHFASGEPECWRAIGKAEQALGRFAESVEAYRRAVSQSDVSTPIGALVRRELAQIQITLGQYSEAESLVIDVMRQPPMQDGDQLQMAQIKQATGDRFGAQQLLNELINRTPENLQARILRGALFVALNDLKRGQEEFEFCLRYAPYDEEIHYRLSQTQIRQGKLSDAAKHLQESRRISDLKRKLIEINRRRANSPQDPKLMDELSELFAALGQPNTSAQWRLRAVSVRQNNRQ